MMRLIIMGEAVLNDIGGHFLHAEGDMVRGFRIQAAGGAEALDLPDRRNELVHGGQVQLQEMLVLHPEIRREEEGGVPAPRRRFRLCIHVKADGGQRQELAQDEIEPDAVHPQDPGHQKRRQHREDRAFQHGNQLGQANPAGGLIQIFEGIIQAAGDQAGAEQPQPQHRHRPLRDIPGDKNSHKERRGGQQQDPHGQAENHGIPAQQGKDLPEGMPVLLMEKDAGQGQGDPADAGRNTVDRIADGRDHREGRDGGGAPEAAQQLIHGENHHHGGGHIEHRRDAGGKELRDFPPGDQLQGEAEDTPGGQEIVRREEHRDIIAEGGGQPHPEHTPLQDTDIEQIQRDIADGHGKHRGNQQIALARDLQEGDQDQGAHGPGRADDEAGQIILRHAVELRILRAGAHEGGDGAPEEQHQQHEEHGEAAGHRDRRRIAGVGFLLQAAAQGAAAGQLDAGGQHTAQRPDDQQDRIGKAVGGDRLCAEETGDHHIIN